MAEGVLATYHMNDGSTPFAFCRHGLMLDPGGLRRYIPFADIADAGYHNRPNIEAAKRAKLIGWSEPLNIRLASGEHLALPVDINMDGMPDLLRIAKLIQQQAFTHRR